MSKPGQPAQLSLPWYESAGITVTPRIHSYAGRTFSGINETTHKGQAEFVSLKGDIMYGDVVSINGMIGEMCSEPQPFFYDPNIEGEFAKAKQALLYREAMLALKEPKQQTAQPLELRPAA